MKNVRTFKKKAAEINNLWGQKKYEQALSKTEALREAFPGNTKLLVMWANLIQLQEETDNLLMEMQSSKV